MGQTCLSSYSLWPMLPFRGETEQENPTMPRPPTFCFIKATTPVRQTQLSNPRSATGGFQVSRAREGSR